MSALIETLGSHREGILTSRRPTFIVPEYAQWWLLQKILTVMQLHAKAG